MEGFLKSVDMLDDGCHCGSQKRLNFSFKNTRLARFVHAWQARTRMPTPQGTRVGPVHRQIARVLKPRTRRTCQTPKRFWSATPQAVAIAAPMMPCGGTSVNPRASVVTAAMSTLFRSSFSCPVIDSKNPTDPVAPFYPAPLVGRIASGDETHKGVVEPETTDRRGDKDDGVGEEEKASFLRAKLPGDDHVHGEGGAGGDNLDTEGDGAAPRDLFEVGVGVTEAV